MRKALPPVFCGGFLIGTCGIAISMAPVRAQTAIRPGSAPFQINPGTADRRQPAAETLADVLDKVVWDADVKGALLIVSPDETVVPPHVFSNVPEPYVPTPPLEADSNGGYRMSQIESHFDRRLVPVHSLSVLAPTTMSVLRTSRLPRPNPYAGMEASAKARLLYSTLTPQEWQTLATPEGIGASDLTRTQRDIFLSMLPDPFIVNSTTMAIGDDGKLQYASGGSTTLTPDQRAAVRLTLNKTISWTLMQQDKRGDVGIGLGDLPKLGTTIRLQSPLMRYGPRKDAYGVVLLEDVPNRSKPSPLPYDWSALDVPVSAGQAKTVGGLVRLIASTTKAQLFCDARYADLTIAFRGASAQAGDILHALAWAVTGTWRRLGDAFVLTDDIVGLGVRHAIIDNWMQENMLLGERRDAAIEKAILDTDGGSYLGWSAADPLKPSTALAEKLSAFEKDSASNPGQHRLEVPVSELSTAAQELARRQIDFWMNQDRDSSNQPARSPLRTDAVRLSEQLSAELIVPGMGSVSARELSGAGYGNPILGESRYRAVSPSRPDLAPAVAAPSPMTWPAGATVRAVVITPTTPAEIESAAREARMHGFNELWVEVRKRSVDLVRAAAAAGASNKLAIRPVVRLLRAAPAEKPDALDRNVLGETTSEHATWWERQLKEIGVVDTMEANDLERRNIFASTFATAWSDPAPVERFVGAGDFVRLDTPDSQTAIENDIAAIAAIPGIAGLVLREMNAVGYVSASPTNGFRFGSSGLGRDPLLQLGYNDDMRLAFLRKYGIDPIDLSLLNQGDQMQIGGSAPGQVTLGLPFFRDYGAGAANSIYNGKRGDTMGAKKTLAQWYDFRVDVNAAAVSAIIDKIKSSAPGLSVTIRHAPDLFADYGAYFGGAEPPPIAPAPAAPMAAAKPSEGFGPPPVNTAGRRAARPRPTSLEETARTQSKTVFFAVSPPAESGDIAESKALFLQRLPFNLELSATWDGVVVDLSAVSVDDAMEILMKLPTSALAATHAPCQ